MSQGRDDHGRYSPRVSEEDVLRTLRDHPEPVATAGDLAEQFEVSAETVRRHLSRLHGRGAVEKKTVGARAVVWWAIEDDNAAPAAPLRNLVGMLDEEAADQARARSREWREAFDEEIERGDEP